MPVNGAVDQSLQGCDHRRMHRRMSPELQRADVPFVLRSASLRDVQRVGLGDAVVICIGGRPHGASPAVSTLRCSRPA